MYRFLSLSCLLLVAFLSPLTAQDAPQEKPWFDGENCAFCKNVAAQEGLMESMTCDTIRLDNGMMMVAFVPENMKASLEKANQGMEATAQKLQSGQPLPMCGFCESYGRLMMAGVKIQKKQGPNSEVTFFTSDDPKVVTQIHEMADRTVKEQAAMKIRLSRHAAVKNTAK